MDPIELERLVHPDETPQEMAKRIMQENLMSVILSLDGLAGNAKSQRTKWLATKQLLDRDFYTYGAERIGFNKDSGEFEDR